MRLKLALLVLASTLAPGASAFASSSSASDVCSSVGKDAVMSYYFQNTLNEEIASKYERQFRDKTLKAYPSPRVVETARPDFPEKLEVRGVSTQAGIYPGAYRFDVLREGGVEVIEVRVYVKKSNELMLQQIRNSVQVAENRWNSEKPVYGFAYKFRFRVVDDPDQALFHVNWKLNTRGPYFKNWDPIYWSTSEYAHEIGHMMGMVDEYEVMTSKSHCDPTSLWCNEQSSFPIKPFHYYMILRRILLTASDCGH